MSYMVALKCLSALERTINNQMQLRFNTGLVQYFN